MASSSMNMFAVSLKTLDLASVPIFTEGSNYKKWRREIGLLLTLNEFDIALDSSKPPELMDKSTKAEKADSERWMRANKIALSILESAMTNTVRGGIKKYALAVDYLKAIENKFKESEKAEISLYMSMLTTYKIDGNISIRDHIMKTTDAVEKLNSMDVKFLKVKEKVKEGVIIVEHFATDLMIANPLTKALPNGVFKDHITQMGVLGALDKWE